MRQSSSHLAAGLLLVSAQANAELIIGLGSDAGFPICAVACARTLAQNSLVCSSVDSYSTLGLNSHVVTTAECYAGDTFYLTTLAYCLRIRCEYAKLKTSQLEEWWEGATPVEPATAVNGKKVLATPKWGYFESLDKIEKTPTQVVMPGQALNFTALVDDTAYRFQLVSNESEVPAVKAQARYGLALMLILMIFPILTTWATYIPGVRPLINWARLNLVYPPLFGRRHMQLHPWFFGNIPTLGQSIYIFFGFALTVIFMGPSYKFAGWPNSVGPNVYDAVLNWVMRRTGLLGYAVLPVVFMFAGRNNPVLYLSEWSHATFLLMHRWVSRLWFLLAVLHSILAWAWAVRTGAYSGLYGLHTQQFWIWGIVATVLTITIILVSGTKIRQWSYNIFLATHVVLAAVLLVGCYYHVWLIPYGIGRYYNVAQDWVYIAIGAWGFDRLVRLARVANNGIRRAKVTDLGNNIVRIDIKGVRWIPEPGKHLYVHFPTLNPLRPWENHPFSWISTVLLEPRQLGPNHDVERAPGLHGAGGQIPDATLLRAPHSESDSDGNSEKAPEALPSSGSESDISVRKPSKTPTQIVNPGAGITLLVRKSKGTTRHLKAQDNLLTLLDGPYHNNKYKSVLRTDRLLLIGGGIGISGLLPWLRTHANIKLAWSVTEESRSLVEGLSDVLADVPEKDIKIGARLDFARLLQEEVESGWEKVGIVLCGPNGLCDDARMAVIKAGKSGKTVFELSVDAYSW